MYLSCNFSLSPIFFHKTMTQKVLFRTPVHAIVPSTFRVDLATSVKPLWKHLTDIPEVCFLGDCKLCHFGKINHHSTWSQFAGIPLQSRARRIKLSFSILEATDLDPRYHGSWFWGLLGVFVALHVFMWPLVSASESSQSSFIIRRLAGWGQILMTAICLACQIKNDIFLTGTLEYVYNSSPRQGLIVSWRTVRVT